MGGKALTHLEENGTYRGEHYLRMVSGSHIIMAIAEGSTAADKLAEAVFYYLMEYTPAIKLDLKLTDVEVTGISTADRFKESGEKQFVVRIGLAWSHLHQWELLPISPVLKKVRIGTPELLF